MFSERRLNLPPARMELSESGFNVTDKKWRYIFNTNFVSPMAFPVLISMLVQALKIGDPLKKITIRDIEGNSKPADVNQLIGMIISQPIPPEYLPFEVEWLEPPLGKCGVMFTFEFISPVTRHFAEVLDNALNIWNHLVFFRGFEFDFELQEIFFPRFGRTGHLSPTIIRHTVDIFEPPYFALNPVFNLASVFHLKGHRLSSITVE
jgi:hypothetical protein